MMKLQIFGCALALAGMLSLTAGADQLYVRNRPFKGYVSGVSKNLGNIRVELDALAKLLGFTVSEVKGNWVAQKSDQPADLPEGIDTTGKLYVNGKELAFTEENAVKVVSLKEFSDLTEGRLRYNAALATVDFDLPASKGPAGSNSRYQLVEFGASW